MQSRWCTAAYIKNRFRAASRSSARKSGWATAISSCARSRSDLPWRLAMPCSVTT